MILTTLLSMLGMDYQSALEGSRYDPLRLDIPEQSKQVFRATLNGPSTPSILINIDGRRIIVFETCMAHDCSYTHSTIAIDVDTKEEYAVSYADDTRTVLKDAPFGSTVDAHCAQGSCDFTPVQLGVETVGEPLRVTDFSYRPGGCAMKNSEGYIVFYSYGIDGIIRFRGEKRVVHGNVFRENAYTDDTSSPIVVKYQNRTLNVLNDNKWITIPVDVKCESDHDRP